MNKHKEPPYDGKPCPACPTVLRNLYAVAQNFYNNLHGNTGPSAYDVYFAYTTAKGLIDAIKDEAVRESFRALATALEACHKVCVGNGTKSVVRGTHLAMTVRDALGPVRALVEAHFADASHSHQPATVSGTDARFSGYAGG